MGTNALLSMECQGCEGGAGALLRADMKPEEKLQISEDNSSPLTFIATNWC